MKIISSKLFIQTQLCLWLILFGGLMATGQSVDLLTGRLEYGVPLGSVSANDISVPVVISQHGNALAVSEGEGDCGMGWGLSAGGSITRVVRGLPDELNTTERKGWLNLGSNYSSIQSFAPSGDDVLSVCSDEASDFTFLNGLAFTYDTEPDLFYFQAPGVNGQFVLNASGTPQLLTLQDIVISTFRSDSFSIKTNRGIVYSFSSVETINRVAGGAYNDFSDFQYNASRNIEFTSRWLLTRIQSTATGTTARITYTTLPEATYHTLKEDSIYFIRDKFLPKRISTIQVKTFKAEFIWANNVVTRVRFLDTASGNDKTFELYYRTFKDYKWNSSTHPFPVAKTFLHKLREVGPNCSPYASYEFTYAKVDWSKEALAKPWRKNNMQDWFGFYNAKPSNYNRPTVYYYDSETDARRTRVTSIANVTPSMTSTAQDRTVATDSVKFGALIKVTTPAGGVIDVTWESNVYYDSATMENLTGGGLRVKTISMNGSDVAYGKATDVFSSSRAVTRTYDYLESNGTTSSGKLLAPLKFGYYTHDGRGHSSMNRGDPSEIMYARTVETVDTLGSTVYEFSIPGVFPQVQKYDWKVTKSLIARKSGTDCACGNYRNGHFAYPFPPSTNFGHRRGFLKGVYQYSNAGTLVRKREMTAQQLPASPPSAIKAIKFEKIGANRFYYGIYETLTGRAQVIATETATEYPESGSTPIVTSTHYSYNSNNILQQVTETLADNSTRVRKLRYVMDFVFTSTPSASDTAAYALRQLTTENRHGELVEQTSRVTAYGSTTVLTDASLVVYRTLNGSTLPYYLKTVPSGVDVNESTVSGGNNVTIDGDYYTVRTFKEYDTEGRPIWEFDKNKNNVTHSYSSSYGFESATFANVRSGQSVAEGFETLTTSGLTVSGGSVTYPQGWTGDNAIQLTTGRTLSSGTITKGLTTQYRISCWAKAESTTSLYFKAYSGSSMDIVTLTINSSGQWKYYEAVVSASTVPSTFTLKVTTSGTVTMDDIVFLPAEGRVGLQTVKPMIGITSASDDRGNSVTYSYDTRGRRVGTFDRNRNLVQKVEYAMQKAMISEPVAGFTSNVSSYKVGTSTTFSALEYCNSGQTPAYLWTVDDNTTQSTSSSMTKTFTVPGRHNVKLKVTKDGISQEFNQDLCFDLAGTPDITGTDSQSNNYSTGFTANCNTPSITFTANNIPTGISGCTTTITWQAVNYVWHTDYYEANVVQALGSGSSVSYQPISAITVRAIVQISCTSGSDLTCLGGGSNFILGFDVNWQTINCN